MSTQEFPDKFPATITWRLARSQSQSSTLERNIQRIGFTGDRYECTVTIPPLTDDLAREFKGFLVNASEGWVTLRDYSYTFDLPAFIGTYQSGRKTIAIGSNQPNVTIKAGSRAQIAGVNQIIEVAEDATTDGSGDATLTLVYPLRTLPSAGAIINFHIPRAAFMLDEDVVSWAVSAPLIHSTEFSMFEDINGPVVDMIFPAFGFLLQENGDFLLQENGSKIQY